MRTFIASPLVPLLLLFATPAKPDPFDLKEVPAKLVIHVPARTGKLERRVVNGKLYNFMPTALTTYASVVAQKSLPHLFRNARSSYPRGTRLTAFPLIIKDNVMQVSLSRQFLKRGFWTNKHKTALAVDAIVKTALEGNPQSGEPLRVLLLVEGKPIRNLAHLDLRKPLQLR